MKIILKKGFTLAECLIAIAVFAIMALIVLTIMTGSLKRHQNNIDVSRSLIEQREALAKTVAVSPLDSSIISMNFSGVNASGVPIPAFSAIFDIQRTVSDNVDTVQDDLTIVKSDIKDLGIPRVPNITGSPGVDNIIINGSSGGGPLTDNAVTELPLGLASGKWDPVTFTLANVYVYKIKFTITDAAPLGYILNVAMPTEIPASAGGGALNLVGVKQSFLPTANGTDVDAVKMNATGRSLTLKSTTTDGFNNYVTDDIYLYFDHDPGNLIEWWFGASGASVTYQALPGSLPPDDAKYYPVP